LTKDGQAKALVPAYCEKKLNNENVFEFFVYQPRASFKIGEDTAFTCLYNLFVVAWRFRWEMIEQWVERLKELQSLGHAADESKIRIELAEFQLDFGRILLDSLNRNLDSPRKIEKQFDEDKDVSILNRIMDPEKGLWTEYVENMQSGISNNDLSITLENLLKLRDLNKTIIILTLKRLNELALEKEGKILE